MPPPLPDPLPASPLPLLEAWIAEAVAHARNPTAMTLATVDPDGRPSARMVICRGFDFEAGWLVFYSDRESRKGRALAALPRAALVLHWDRIERQVRIEGPVTPAPDAQVDGYWKSRPVDARVAAIATVQSRPLTSRSELMARVAAEAERLGADPPRPERWVGYRVWAETVELWVGQPARVHDRALWTRPLVPAPDGFSDGPWRSTRLEP
ncbi:MAG TPA: pyridoxal 5'-phosphate synthase [Candidatus Methylomirabilis sp.]|nr:pyridoxal 5'-phosphate synthase [Candidatus Methylomirabilis sp.]